MHSRFILPSVPLLASSLLLSGCPTPTIAPEPTRDEQAYAIASAMDQVLSMGRCDDYGAYWLYDDGTSSRAMTGRSTGVAGIIKGLTAGVSELDRSNLETAGSDPLLLDKYLEALRSAAGWLMAHARTDEDGEAIYWPLCIAPAIAASGQGIDMSACPPDFSTSARDISECGEALGASSSSLRRGVAGVGDAFIDLFELELFTPEERLEYLDFAIGAGNWLVSQALDNEGSLCWPQTESLEGPALACETSLDRGAAGIGYFLLRLSAYAPEGQGFLEAAIRTAAWLEANLTTVQIDGETRAFASRSTLDETVSPGFYNGNAGVAYFMMSMYQETRDTEFAEAARAILAWLGSSDVQSSRLGGIAWAPMADVTYDRHLTGVEEGAAGIGWTFLQAASLFASKTGDPDPTYLETANLAAAWLGHPEIAHYYQGYVWWPSVATLWSATAIPAYLDISDPDSQYPAESDELYADASDTALLYHTGLLRGLAGVGWFLEDLALVQDGLAQYECSQYFAREVGNQAARWLYYKGRPVGENAYWSWSPVAVRLLSTEEIADDVAAGYDLGVAGTLSFLARDRAADSEPPEWPAHSLLGFDPLYGP